MNMNQELSAEHIHSLNTIARYLSRRDVALLTKDKMIELLGKPQADLLILLGSSIVDTAQKAADAVHAGAVKELMIVGGIGHSTADLIRNVKQMQGGTDVETEGCSESEILLGLLHRRMGIDPREVLLETESTNCGANAVRALQVLQEHGKQPSSIVLIQDPAMQRRSHASFEKVWKAADTPAAFISYAPFIAQLMRNRGQAQYESVDGIVGPIWDLNRYLSLLLGEIARLSDDENGYGPNGKGFINHVDIPPVVLDAYDRIRGPLSHCIRAGFPS